jgi:hypothetical protein
MRLQGGATSWFVRRIAFARLSRRAASSASAHFVTLASVRSLPRRPPVNSDEPRAQGPIDSFAWQYSFYAYLIYRQAPATQEQLADLAQALHIMKGRHNPIQAADEVLLTWPFEVTE